MRRSFLLAILALLVVGVCAVSEQVLYVPEDYPTIQAAIDAAEPADTVRVAAGRYEENLTIEKPLRLVGVGRTAVRIASANPEQPVVWVVLDTGVVSLEGFSVSGGMAGVRMQTAANGVVRIVDVLVLENEFGLFVVGEGSVVVDRCLVIDNETGIFVAGGRTEVVDSEIDRGVVGLMLTGRASVTMAQCLVGLAQIGVSTYTTGCGWESSPTAFTGTVNGEGNRIFGTSMDLCPEFAGAPWPEDFVDLSWRAAVEEIVTAYNEGVQAFQTQDSAGAHDAYSRALLMFESATVSFHLLESYLLQSIGAVYSNLGRYDEALAAYQSARAGYLDREMEVNIAKVDENIGVVYAEIGWYDEALAAFQSARAVYVDREMEVNIAKVDQSIGVVYRHLGRYDEALAAHQSARAVYVDREMEVDIAEVDNNIGVVYRHLGRYDEALAAYQSARAVFVDREMEVDIAGVDANIGAVYRHLGRYDEALAVYQSARAVYVDREMEVDIAMVDQNIGVVYANLGRYDEALAAYQSARAVYVDREMEVDIANVDQNMGVVYKDLGRYDEALAALQSARAIFVDHEMEVRIAGSDQNIGIVYTKLSRYDEALAAHQSARAVYADREMEVDIAEIDSNIGGVYWNLGRYDEALAAFQSALDRLDATAPVEGMELSYPTQRRVIHSNMGSAYEALKEWDQAVAAYQRAITLIESIRGSLTSEDIKLAWQERTQSVYGRLIDLLYRMGQGSSAFPYAERCRARTFLDGLYQVGLAPEQLQRSEEGIVTSTDVSVPVLNTVLLDQAVDEGQRSLLPDEAVLEYMVTEKGLYLWIITSTSGVSDPIYVEYPREQLLREVVALRREIEPQTAETDSGTSVFFSDPTEALGTFYELLVQPALAQLDESVDTLILVPSGPLWYVPFAALAMTDRSEIQVSSSIFVTEYRPTYLIDEYTLAFLPSLACLPMLMEADIASTGNYLAFANPTLSEERQTVYGPHYQYGVLEAACRAFATYVEGSEADIYVQADARESLAYNSSTGQRVLMYACHGDFNPGVPLASRLLLAPSEQGAAPSTDRRLADGNYHASEVLLTDHRGVDLVVLAACETLLPALREIEGTLGMTLGPESDEQLNLEQLELIVAGDEVVGLARSFLSSGANSVLATLWQANPMAIEKLLVALGEHAQAGMTWSQALRRAQRELIANESYDDVWFWAPYQLIGRWR